MRALDRAWRAAGEDGRITRDWRARAMGLSPTTSDKILRGTGVDHATLFHAFRSLNADWDEGFAERIPDEEPPVVVSEEPTPRAAEETDEQPPRPRKWRPSRTAALVALVALLAVSAATFLPRNAPAALPKPMPEAEQQEFLRLFNAANAAYHRAEYGKASEDLARARALADRYPAVAQRVNAKRLEADITLARGRYEEAVMLYEEAIALRWEYGAGPMMSSLWHALGQAHLAYDEAAKADPVLQLAFRAATLEQDQKALPYLFRDMGSAAVEQGQIVAAEERFARAHALNDGADKGLEADVDARQGLLLARKGRYADAREKLKRSLGFWSNAGHPRWIATTERQLGEVEAMAGNVVIARQHFERARAGYGKVGDLLGQRKTERLLALLAP